jgi:5-oxoprolinase (ATP-hydrolysing) subunit C
MAHLRILSAGPACTLQDAGRMGLLRYGVTPAGTMDWIARREVNAFAGNNPDATVIEIGPGGIALMAEGGDLRLGLSATGFLPRIGEAAVPARIAVTLRDGETLTIRPGPSHVWACLAVTGGFAVAPVLGSLSTHLRSAVGPLGGRALQTGDTLPVHSGAGAATGPPAMVPAAPDVTAPGQPIRVIPGPQDDHFTEDALATFLSADFTLSPQSDRMGYRLTGPRIAHRAGHDIVSDGIAMGSVQVPGDGQPIVLMADRQPTGGYPKIATVIRADLPRLAQTRADGSLRFAAVTVAEAVAALVKATLTSQAIRAGMVPLRSGPDLTRLASGDFASGFVDAKDP